MPAALSGLLLLLAEAAAAQPPLVPSDSKAQLLALQPKYALWLSSELHAETASHRAPTYTHRFYRQRLDQPNAEWIYELVDVAVGYYKAALRDDGMLLLETRRKLHVVSPDGATSVQDLPWLQTLAVYADGVLAQDWSTRDPRQFQPVVFVPFDGVRLHLAEPIQVVNAGVKSFTGREGLGYPGEPYRAATSWRG